MPTKVLVPRLGEGVEEVTISKWLKQEGESVKELEALLEVNTDKVDTEIPSPATGVVLKLILPEGTVARVGEVLAVIGKAGESVDGSQLVVDSAKRPAGSNKPLPDDQSSPVHQQPTTANKDLGFISPVVSKMAAEQGVNLQLVKGTGLGGRITKNDVLAFVERGGASAQATGPAITARAFQQQGDQLIKHTIIRKSIAEHMVTSKNISPHVLTVMEANMSRAVAHRAANKESFARDGINLTFTAYFVAAIAAGLKAYPMTNSSWTDEGVLVHKAVNIGMATSLGEEGLIVPVIKGADELSLLGVARAVNDLSSRARAKKLQPDEVKGGTFTLTNHGVSNSLFAMPIINQPQCGILGVGAMQKRAVVISSKDGTGDDAIAIRPMVYLSFVFDHRILDGASADWFLVKVKETLENWQ
jgi:pyruvate/2-oxoglutarate dehydrogenase complex dihydrolipoamide acyltransferase (E2) component